MGRVVVVAELGIGAGAVVGAFGGVGGAGGGAGALQLFAAGRAHQHMDVAVRVGAVHEAVAGLLAVLAMRNHRGVNPVYLHGHAVVEDVALAVEVLAARLEAVFDDAAVELVHVFKTLFQQVGTGFFALHPAGAIRQDFLVLELLEALHSLGEVSEVFHVQRHGIFEAAEVVLVVGAHVHHHHVVAVLKGFEFLGGEMPAGLFVGAHVAQAAVHNFRLHTHVQLLKRVDWRSSRWRLESLPYSANFRTRK